MKGFTAKYIDQICCINEFFGAMSSQYGIIYFINIFESFFSHIFRNFYDIIGNYAFSRKFVAK